MVVGCDNSTEPELEGCDGISGSGLLLDECGVCGGDNTSCIVCENVYSELDSSFVSCGEGCVEIESDCYYQNDLDVLQIFIDNSIGTINMDMDNNGNGVIEPLELGSQTWDEGRINYLNCQSDGLSGEIPPEIGNLTNLIGLDLMVNQLSGEITSSIENLTNLYFLGLTGNQLTGEIPSEIGNLTNLERLYLYDNQLSGEIPVEIGNLTNLTYLNLWDNQLTGEIPVEIGNLTNLTYLNLGSNQLTGEIPPEIGNLTNLTVLYLLHTQLTGEIPPELGNLTNLNILLLNDNQLTGEIPPEIGNLTNLYYLFISDNQLTSLPYTICDLNIDWYDIYSFTSGNNSICLESDIPECIINTPGFNVSPEWDLTGDSSNSITFVYQPQNCDDMSISELTQPIQYTLHQPFPNPFNPTTSISFSIPEQSQTSLKVYDIKGNLISTLLNQTMNVGHHQVEWNGENLSSGTYFIRINSGEFSDVKKVVLVK